MRLTVLDWRSASYTSAHREYLIAMTPPSCPYITTILFYDSKPNNKSLRAHQINHRQNGHCQPLQRQGTPPIPDTHLPY